MISIRDWHKDFEQDRSRQWKNLTWVPIPNKLNGSGYTLMMEQKNGVELFGAWIALVELASRCRPRGTLKSDSSEYSEVDISRMTRIPLRIIKSMISFCSERLDWIIICGNLDTHVKNLDKCALESAVGRSSLVCSILNTTNASVEDNASVSSARVKMVFIPPAESEFLEYCQKNGFSSIATRAYRYYSEQEWRDSRGKKIISWKGKLQAVWFKDENRDAKFEKVNWDNVFNPPEGVK